MQVRLIAVLLSFLFISVPLHAVPKNPVKSQPLLSQKIDLNHADLSTLTGSFKGIGKKRAEAIIAYRDSHHGFKSLEELAEVKGIGQSFLEKNREKLNAVYTLQ